MISAGFFGTVIIIINICDYVSFVANRSQLLLFKNMR